MLVVQKYGGSSIADVGRVRHVAQRVVDTVQGGSSVVVVVSAMGGSTDQLLALAKQVDDPPPRRELDMLLTAGERISMALLSMAVQKLGRAAISLTGSQSGIITDSNHNDARIIDVRPQRIRENLDQNHIVIVAGYQGVSREREVTTLGRGGSDTTAVALAAALRADQCEICSDVDGVYSADPRLVPSARRFDQISYTDMLALAQSGARVLAASAIEYAAKHRVPLHARATAGTGPGTRIQPDAPAVRAVAARDGELTLVGVDAGRARAALSRVGATDIRVDGQATRGRLTEEVTPVAMRQLHAECCSG